MNRKIKDIISKTYRYDSEPGQSLATYAERYFGGCPSVDSSWYGEQLMEWVDQNEVYWFAALLLTMPRDIRESVR